MSAFVRRVIWTQLRGRNTRYTLYRQEALSKDFTGRRFAILVVPGNPGNDRFYDVFCMELMRQMLEAGHMVTLCSISHANHVLIDDDDPANYTIAGEYKFADFMDKNPICYDVHEQIEHKLDFCREIFAPYTENCETIFIGHSIGAFISIRALETLRTIENRWRNSVSRCYALFPAVERLADTPQGRRLRHILRFFAQYNFLTRMITYPICEMASRSFRNRAAKWFIGAVESQDERNVAEAASHLSPSNAALVKKHPQRCAPHCVVDAATELVRTDVIRNIIHMANHELQVIDEFDCATLRDAAEANCRLCFFYTFGDGWGPAEFGREMRARITELSGTSTTPHMVRIDEEARFEHAFVMRDSREMATVLYGMIFDNESD